jgi:putative two-component system response regulator
VHVCDVYDALRTERPYREAWPAERALGYLSDRAGTEFSRDLVDPFVHMMRQHEQRVVVLTDPAAPIPVAPAAEPVPRPMS